MKNYYDVLGVRKDASEEDIKRAYRKIVKDTHPDMNNGSRAKEAVFIEATLAYSILTDPKQRKAYDEGYTYDRDVSNNQNEDLHKKTAGGKTSSHYQYQHTDFRKYVEIYIDEIPGLKELCRNLEGDCKIDPRLDVSFVAWMASGIETVENKNEASLFLNTMIDFLCHVNEFLQEFKESLRESANGIYERMNSIQNRAISERRETEFIIMLQSMMFIDIHDWHDSLSNAEKLKSFYQHVLNRINEASKYNGSESRSHYYGDESVHDKQNSEHDFKGNESNGTKSKSSGIKWTKPVILLLIVGLVVGVFCLHLWNNEKELLKEKVLYAVQKNYPTERLTKEVKTEYDATTVYGWKVYRIDKETYYIEFGYDHDFDESNGYNVISFESVYYSDDNISVRKVSGYSELEEKYRNLGYID